MSPETKKPNKPTEIHFKPEGYTPPDSIEFFEQLVGKLREAGFNSDEIIYSGMDAANLYNPNGSIKRPQGIFGMNEIAWVKAAKNHDDTPAGYATGGMDPRYELGEAKPVIALYDRNQLALVYSHNMRQELIDYAKPVELDLEDAEINYNLADRPSSDPVEEVMVHKDFPQDPDASPTDALLGVVVFEHE